MEHPFLDPVDPTSWLHNLVQGAITQITTQDFGTRFGSSGCIFVDIGEYLVAIIQMLSELARHLTRGHHIEIYCERREVEMEKEDDFSRLDPVDYMSDQYRNLKYGAPAPRLATSYDRLTPQSGPFAPSSQKLQQT